ncbi:hypothetical protein R69927_04186 [Paraburkholderia domus]|jgi:hypothetical protein|uniref:Uncharacterized protein n=1 Tax=Paraburkholderia domus TaxID=2793075 RepID=A0A9N8MQN3_9BURK|nr:hypothetical protein R70006_04644 [Paraburkholderia domus]CAE6852238.1 hypothetical protein R69749_04975 [Paraburkholderia domus]CAE6879928.1 hypothetical protein R69927_04186 [Paraburkholderia domus]CAE6887467.1 hypothetical protein R70211_02498 [Paraburkholderia domus]CAE6895519.1 hypothetical protein R75471_02647 [Paraburkholderia domus]
MSSSENPEIPDLPDLGRALQDEVGYVFRQERARQISRDIFHELRWDVDDKFVRRILQTVFIADTNLPGQTLGGEL